MINAAIYIRVSTERQVIEGFSLSAQEITLKEFVKSQGWNLYDIYADCGISGKNIIERDAVKKLISDIKNKKINVVVLYKFDRLTRDMRDTEEFMKLIEDYDIMVYTLSGGLVDVSSPSGRFNTRILGAAAQYERENIQERIIVGLREKVRKGYSLCSGTPSYGYNRQKHQEIQTINKYESLIVKRIFNMYNSGLNFKEISNTLNAEGIPTKKNKLWQSKTIRLILSNPTYIGKVRYGINREQVPLNDSNKIENKKKGFIANGKHKAIIDINTWNITQTKLSKIKKIHRTNYPKNNAYFCGFLFCEKCNKNFTTMHTKKIKKDGTSVIHISYRCINKIHNNCNAKSISHNKVEKTFIEYLNNLKDIPKFINIKNQYSPSININELNKRLLELTKKRKEIIKLYINNTITKIEMESILSNIRSQINIIDNEIKNYNNQQKNNPQINNIKEYWKNLNNQEKRLFLTTNIEKIYIINDKIPVITKVIFSN